MSPDPVGSEKPLTDEQEKAMERARDLANEQFDADFCTVVSDQEDGPMFHEGWDMGFARGFAALSAQRAGEPSCSSRGKAMKGVRLYLTRDEAVTLLTRLDDLAQLEPEVPAVARIREKIRTLMGLDAARQPKGER